MFGGRKGKPPPPLQPSPRVVVASKNRGRKKTRKRTRDAKHRDLPMIGAEGEGNQCAAWSKEIGELEHRLPLVGEKARLEAWKEEGGEIETFSVRNGRSSAGGKNEQERLWKRFSNTSCRDAPEDHFRLYGERPPERRRRKRSCISMPISLSAQGKKGGRREKRGRRAATLSTTHLSCIKKRPAVFFVRKKGAHKT